MSKQFTVQMDVRFADLDMYGHVNSTTFFTYMETARVKLFMDTFQELTKKGILLVVVSAECNYKKEIFLNDKVFVTVSLDKLGNSSFDLTYDIHNGDGKLFAVGKTTLVAIDAKQKAPIALPKEILDMAKNE